MKNRCRKWDADQRPRRGMFATDLVLSLAILAGLLTVVAASLAFTRQLRQNVFYRQVALDCLREAVDSIDTFTDDSMAEDEEFAKATIDLPNATWRVREGQITVDDLTWRRISIRLSWSVRKAAPKERVETDVWRLKSIGKQPLGPEPNAADSPAEVESS